jgi:vancomycin aglycone glucosyltransferase
MEGVAKMRVLLSTDGSRGDIERMVALAIELDGLGAEARLCAPPDLVPAGECDAPVATGVMLIGEWR